MIKEFSFKQLIWLLPLVFIIHNFEEGITMQQWLGGHSSTIPNIINIHLPLWFWLHFGKIRTTALIIATIMPSLAILLIPFLKTNKFPAYILCITAWLIIINSVQHIILTLFLRIYTPGVVSAILINLPFGLLLLNTLNNNQKWILPKKSKWFLLSLLIYPVFMLAIWGISTLVVKIIFL